MLSDLVSCYMVVYFVILYKLHIIYSVHLCIYVQFHDFLKHKIKISKCFLLRSPTKIDVIDHKQFYYLLNSLDKKNILWLINTCKGADHH